MNIYFTPSALGNSADSHKFNARALSSRLVRTGFSQIVEKSTVVSCKKDSLDIILSQITSKTFKIHSNNSSKIVDDRISSIIGNKGKSEKRLSLFVAVYTLNKSEMVTRHLSIDDVGLSLHTFMGSDAIVTWSAKWENEWTIIVHPPTWSINEEHDRIVTEAVHDALLEHACVNGIDAIKKAVPTYTNGSWSVETEGSDIIEIAQLSEVDALKTSTNNIQEVARVLGVEAALCLMQSELHRVLSFDGSYVDPRHTWLLSDTVARSGLINPLNRHKMEELGGSLLQCASFEQTLDVFEHGAAFGKSDNLGGATEKLIVGQPVHVGTGSFAILEEILVEEECGTFVPPLFIDNEFEDVTMRVAPLGSIISNNDTYVKSIDKQSKPAFNRVVNINDIEYKPPSDLPIGSFDTDLSNTIIPLIQLMRKKAQTREPIWIVANIVPLEDGISKEEFTDIEKNLESYSGWVQRSNSRGSHFTQFTEVEYIVNKQNIISRVEFNQETVTTNHRSKHVLLSIEKSISEPFDAWSIHVGAISWVKIHSDDLPTTVNPNIVRVIHEKVFEKGPWIIRIVRTWTGENIIETE